MFKNTHPLLRWIGALTVLLGTATASFAQNTFATATDLTGIMSPMGTYTFTGGTTASGDDFTTASTPGSATAQSSDDVFYKVHTNACTDQITLSTCGMNTNFDTYIHLLDASGAEIASNDNSGLPGCVVTVLNESGLTFMVASGTDYYIVVEGAGTASGNFDLNITEEDLVPLVATATSADVCEGGTIMLAATPSGGSYAWIGLGTGAAYASSTQNPSITGATDANNTGIYEVEVTLAGCMATANVFVQVNALSTVDAGPPSAICATNGTVNLTGNITGATSGTWSGGGGSFSGLGAYDPAGVVYTPGTTDLTGFVAGSKTITLTLTSAVSAAGCPAEMSTVMVTLYECPDLVVASPAVTTTFCGSASIDLNTTIMDNSAAVGTTTWYPTQADAQAETAALGSSTVMPTATTTYWARKNTATAPVCTDIISTIITVNALPNVTATASGPLSCNTPSVTLTAASTDVVAPTFTWVALTPGATRTATALGTYTVTATSAASCTSTAAVIVTGALTPSGPLAGTYFIPSVCFPTIASAATYFNANGVSANVTFEVANTHTETAPATGIEYLYNVALPLANQTTAAQTITFRRNAGAGTHPLVTAGVGTTLLADAIFRIVGVDYITFDAIDVQEDAANTTGTTQAEYGYAFFKASATDGAQNNTVQNCMVTLNRLNTNTIGLYVSSLDAAAGAGVVPTAASGANSYNKFYSNTIQNTLYPIVLSGDASLNDVDNEIGAAAMGNTVTNWGGGATFPTNETSGAHNAVQIWQQGNIKVIGNTISGFAGATGTVGIYGVYSFAFNAATPVPNVTITNNTITTTATGLTTNAIYGIYNAMPALTTTSTVNITNNTINNTGVLTTGVMYGVFSSTSATASPSLTVNITNNTINEAGSMTGGSLQSIIQVGTGLIPALNMSNNTITLLQTNTAAGNTTFMRGVRNVNTPSLLMNFNSNTMTGCRNASTNSGSFRFIDNAAQGGIAGSPAGTININGNTLSDMKPAVGNAISLTGQLIFFGNTGAAPIRTGTLNVKNNTIQNVRLSTTTASSDFFFFMGGTTGGCLNAAEISGNTIDDITYTSTKGAGAVGANVTMFLNQSPVASNIISNNTVTNITLFSGIPTPAVPNGFIGINGVHAATSGTESVSNNTFNNINVGSAATSGPAYLIYCTSGLGYTKTFNNNSITNVSNAAGAFGITVNNGGTATISNNTINNINTGISGNIIGITTTGNTSNTISGNTISNLANTNANGQVTGINTGGTVASTQSISKNNIFNFSTAGAGATGALRGIVLAAGVATVSNNYISAFSTTNLSSTSAIIGIQQTSVEAFNAYFNTVAFGGLPTAGVAGTALTTGGTNLGGAGIQYVTGAPVNMRNNILYTNIGAKGTGIVSAIRRSTAGTAGTLNAGTGSLVLNNNVYYTPSVVNSYVYVEGVSTAASTNAYDFASVGTGCGSTYKTFMNPNESGTYAEVTPFLNTGATPLNLQVDGAFLPTSYTSNSAVTIAGLTTDYFAVTRAATPDMGAAEFAGASVDFSAPVVTFTPVPTQNCPSALVLNTTITDASGINVTAGTTPRLWYKLSTETDVLPATNTSANNGWKYVEGVAGASNAFAFTFDYSLLTATVSAGSTIQYFISAQDLAGTPNVVTTANMTGCPSSVALTTNFPTISGVSSFLVNGSPTGPFTTTSTSNFICGSGNLTLGVTPSGPGLTYDWYSSADGVSFTTLLGTSSVPSFAVTGVSATTWYRADLQCSGASIAGSPASSTQVIVNDPMLLTATATPLAVCGAQPISLMATANAGATVSWFPTASSNTAISPTTGITIPMTTTFYAEAQNTTSVAILGNPNILTTPVSSIDARINNGQIFSTGTAIGQINSVNIYPAVAGDVVILLLDAGNAVVNSATMAVSGAQVSATAPTAGTVPVVMPLNFRIPANSTNWKVVVSSNFTYPAYPNSVTLWRSIAATTYAYPYSADGLTMSSSTAGNTFMYFYNIQTQSICKSPRQAVTVTYSAPAAAVITPSSSAPFCPGGSTTLVASGGTYTTFSWSDGTATASNAVSPVATTTYTVSASDASCSATASYTVVVLPAPTLTPATATPAAICAGSSSTIAVTATAPTPVMFGNAPGINMALPDAPAPGNSNVITLAGAPAGATITGIAVHLKGTHTYIGDVNFTLTCPTSTLLDLTPPAGTANSSDDFNVNFSSSATVSWTVAPIVVPPTVLTGNFLPTGAGGFPTLYGCPINGAWTITGTDAGGGDFGVLTDWDITINYSLATPITYAWTSGATTASTSVSPTIPTTNYTVTVTNAANGCTATSSTTVTVTQQPVAGTNATLSACASATPTDMKTLIGTYDAGGVWAETSATLSTTGVTAAGLFTTAGNAGGTYTFTYTVAATAPCTLASTATVSVTVSAAPSTLVTLPTTTGTLTLVEGCTDGTGWTYYHNPGNAAQNMFAINWNPANNATVGFNSSIRTGAVVTITLDPTFTQIDDTDERTVSMKRYWNIQGGGTGTLDGPVNIKFFYDAAEKTAVETRAGSGGTLPSPVVGQLPNSYEGFKWFKSTSASFGPACVAAPAPDLCGVLELTDVNAGTLENGVLYAQFNGVPSFSGGTGAAGWGPSATPLPVKLLSFTGAINGKTNELTWKTATEQNVASFIVERSNNGTNDFKAVGNSVAPTNTTVAHTYSLTDADPTTRAYYRLRMTDLDGTVAYSNIVSLVRRGSEFAVAAIFPNPTNGIVNVEYELASATSVNFVVIDVLGRVMTTVRAQAVAGLNVQKIDLADFASGVYTIIMDKGTTERVVRKVVKE